MGSFSTKTGFSRFVKRRDKSRERFLYKIMVWLMTSSMGVLKRTVSPIKNIPDTTINVPMSDKNNEKFSQIVWPTDPAWVRITRLIKERARPMTM